jgi:methylmalonyl-CoA/ethylmalonyl-CoA epimerase
MKVLGVNHIGLAAKDPDKARWFLGEVMGLAFLGDERVADQKVDTTMFTSVEAAAAGQRQVEPSRLEILQNQPGEDGPIQNFIDKRGGGIHHLALQVDDLAETLAYLKEKNVKLIDEVPRRGAHQTRIAFVHPHATGGLLIELVEEGA